MHDDSFILVHFTIKINNMFEININKALRLIMLSGLIFTLSINSVKSQFYYSEWLSNADAAAEWKSMKNTNFRIAKMTCYETDDVLNNSFFCEKKYSKDYLKSTLLTRTSEFGKSKLITEYHSDGRLKSTYDSSAQSVRKTSFFYDSQNRLYQTINVAKSNDDDFVTEIKEAHTYVYNSKGFPEELIRVKNDIDSNIILFYPDEFGNVAMEKDIRIGSLFYYYYDSSQRITDIVMINDFKKNMLPDYLFDYDENGNLIQMKTMDGPASSYTTWRYEYDQGLKKRALIYNSKGTLMNRFEYTYK